MTLRLALLALVVALATPLAAAKACPSAPQLASLASGDVAVTGQSTFRMTAKR
jgi:hypothetical protein